MPVWIRNLWKLNLANYVQTKSMHQRICKVYNRVMCYMYIFLFANHKTTHKVIQPKINA